MVDQKSAVRREGLTMPSDTDTLKVTIRKRPLWLWVLAGLWVLLEILFLQTAMASAREGEYSAAAISWIAVGITAAAGVLVGFLQGRSNAPAG